MNLHTAWEAREKLNEKMTRLLLQGLQTERTNYERAIVNYPPDRMEKYGKPFLAMLNDKIVTVEQLLKSRFTNNS